MFNEKTFCRIHPGPGRYVLKVKYYVRSLGNRIREYYTNTFRSVLYTVVLLVRHHVRCACLDKCPTSTLQQSTTTHATHVNIDEAHIPRGAC